MLFNSLHFILFFPIVLLLHFSLKLRARNAFLFLASYYFYMAWMPSYALLIFSSTIVDFFLAKSISRSKNTAFRKALLIFSLSFNLGFLFFFKYLNFAISQVNVFFEFFGVFSNFRSLDLILPVGISFYTFQTLSYTIDIYKREIEPEKSFIKFATFVSFFPQLVAGPIERASNLLPQFSKNFSFSSERLKSALPLIIFGYFKKLLVADPISTHVDQVFNSPTDFFGLSSILAIIYFSIQIYCDFSAYSDIAIGIARIMGIDLMTNFKAPYLSKSIREFWSRWHISLSSWFRDYVYIPLGGSRRGMGVTIRNTLVIFLVSGIWHGANWTFIVWGLIHGLIISAEIIADYGKRDEHMTPIRGFSDLVKTLYTFTIAVVAFVFFRADSFSDAISVLGNSIVFSQTNLVETKFQFIDHFLAFFFVGLLFVYDYCHFNNTLAKRTYLRSKPIQFGVAFATLALIFYFGQFSNQSFIYFQF